jgi:hypothetical protein
LGIEQKTALYYRWMSGLLRGSAGGSRACGVWRVGPWPSSDVRWQQYLRERGARTVRKRGDANHACRPTSSLHGLIEVDTKHSDSVAGR